jgi:tripartite-type tricarboxylate transporter receptor subunit TctC
LNAALVAAIKDPGNNKALIDRGAEPVGSSIDEHAASIKSQVAQWRKVAKEAGIQPQ